MQFRPKYKRVYIQDVEKLNIQIMFDIDDLNTGRLLRKTHGKSRASLKFMN